MSTFKNRRFWYSFFESAICFLCFILILPFFARTQLDLLGASKYVAQTMTNFVLLSEENTKNEPFLTF